MSCFVPPLLACGLGAPDRLLEPQPLAVAKQRLQLARARMFGAMIVATLERFEGGLGGGTVGSVVGLVHEASSPQTLCDLSYAQEVLSEEVQ